jgi:hypothetical protein
MITGTVHIYDMGFNYMYREESHRFLAIKRDREVTKRHKNGGNGWLRTTNQKLLSSIIKILSEIRSADGIYLLG